MVGHTATEEQTVAQRVLEAVMHGMVRPSFLEYLQLMAVLLLLVLDPLHFLSQTTLTMRTTV